MADNLPELDWAYLVDGELLDARFTPETLGWTVGQPDSVIILALFGAELLPHQLPAAVAAAIKLPVVAGMPQCQHAGLVQRYVGNRLARRVEFELWFVLLILVFGHDDAIIILGRLGDSHLLNKSVSYEWRWRV